MNCFCFTFYLLLNFQKADYGINIEYDSTEKSPDDFELQKDFSVLHPVLRGNRRRKSNEY
jgi:hypothetical protein